MCLIASSAPASSEDLATRSPSSSRRALRKGTTAIQFAIVGPVFFAMVLGTIEVGRGIMVRHMLTNAARMGCRVGVLEGKANSDVTTAVNDSLAIMGISGDTVAITVNDGTGDIGNAAADAELTVTVSVPVSKITWVPVMKYLSGSLVGQYTLRKE